MRKLLQIDSSGKGQLSMTRPLTEHFAKVWKEANPGGQVVYRDLMDSNLQFVNPDIVGAFYTPEEKLTGEQSHVLAQSNKLLAELLEADVYVFGIPMYNFSVPAVFKAYIDLVVRAGKTFSFEGGTPRGLLSNKKLIVISASGGDYSTEPAKSLDFLEPYVRTIMGFIGVTDVDFIRVHGHDPETISATTKAATDAIDSLLKPAATSSSRFR